MRYNEIISESRMADLAAIYNDIRKLPSVTISVDEKLHKLYINFSLYNVSGKMKLKLRPQGSYEKTNNLFRSLLYAAAVSTLNGRKPMNFKEVINTVSGNIRPGAIKILTNPENWEIEKLSHDGFVVEDKNFFSKIVV